MINRIKNIEELYEYLIKNYNELCNVKKIFKTSIYYLDEKIPFIFILCEGYKNARISRIIKRYFYDIIDVNYLKIYIMDYYLYFDSFLILILPKKLKPINVHYHIKKLLKNYYKKS